MSEQDPTHVYSVRLYVDGCLYDHFSDPDSEVVREAGHGLVGDILNEAAFKIDPEFGAQKRVSVMTVKFARHKASHDQIVRELMVENYPFMKDAA